MTNVNKRRQDNLPSLHKEFVGRQREVAQIERALADPAINVVIIYFYISHLNFLNSCFFTFKIGHYSFLQFIC